MLTPERIKELSDRHLRVVGAGYVRPQDAEEFARAVLAKWGTPPAVAGEPVATLHCNQDCYVWARATEAGKRLRFEEPMNLYTTPQPAQAQAGAITPPPIECNTEELKRAYAFGWWSALEKQRETAQAGAVPLNHKNIEPVRRFLADRGIYLSDETTKALITVAHGIKGGQHGAE